MTLLDKSELLSMPEAAIVGSLVALGVGLVSATVSIGLKVYESRQTRKLFLLSKLNDYADLLCSLESSARKTFREGSISAGLRHPDPKFQQQDENLEKEYVAKARAIACLYFEELLGHTNLLWDTHSELMMSIVHYNERTELGSFEDVHQKFDSTLKAIGECMEAAIAHSKRYH